MKPGSGIWRDEQVRGLMVVSHKTTKTYAVQGDVRRNGRHVRSEHGARRSVLRRGSQSLDCEPIDERIRLRPGGAERMERLGFLRGEHV